MQCKAADPYKESRKMCKRYLQKLSGAFALPWTCNLLAQPHTAAAAAPGISGNDQLKHFYTEALPSRRGDLSLGR